MLFDKGPCRIAQSLTTSSQPLQIVSFWDMMQINSQMTAAISFISGCMGEWRVWKQLLPHAPGKGIAAPDIAMETRAHFLKSCQTLSQTASELGMVATHAAAERAYRDGANLLASPIGYDANRLGRVVGLAEHLLQVFGDEMAGRRLLTLSGRYARHFTDKMLFGPEVDDALS